MPKEITFLCPKCAGTTIEEVQVDIVVATEISILGSGDSAVVEYGEQTNEGGRVERYQCQDCCYTIVGDGTNEDELIEALKELANVG